MRLIVLVVYVAMAVWLLIAAVLRINIQLASGVSLDALPFISGAIGLAALVLLIPTYDDWRGRRDRKGDPGSGAPNGWPNSSPED